MNGHSEPELFDSIDMQGSDPEYDIYAAENEAREDFDKGISLVAGLTKLRVRGSSEAEIHAYLTTYQTNRMAADMGLTLFLDMRPF